MYNLGHNLPHSFPLTPHQSGADFDPVEEGCASSFRLPGLPRGGTWRMCQELCPAGSRPLVNSGSIPAAYLSLPGAVGVCRESRWLVLVPIITPPCNWLVHTARILSTSYVTSRAPGKGAFLRGDEMHPQRTPLSSQTWHGFMEKPDHG